MSAFYLEFLLIYSKKHDTIQLIKLDSNTLMILWFKNNFRNYRISILKFLHIR